MKGPRISESQVTDEAVYLNRREVLRLGTAATLAAVLGGCPAAEEARAKSDAPVDLPRKLEGVKPADAAYRIEGPTTSYEDATTYNNFYEFGTDKGDPSAYAHTLKTEPWSVLIDGEVAKPGRVPLEDVLAAAPLEERIYRFRCVEAWSMVVPWVGIPLAKVLARYQPTSKARYVAFETLVAPEQMPGQKRSVIDWPYREGLRIDEAMHPLAILAVGMYGRALPNQNGAPLRLVVPWKYGFKSVKSIVRIQLTETQPRTSWNELQPSEYGFYANVNPEVDHPRWSQARERPLGGFRKQPTLPFNGYGEQVAGLYAGMDLRKSF